MTREHLIKERLDELRRLSDSIAVQLAEAHVKYTSAKTIYDHFQDSIKECEQELKDIHIANSIDADSVYKNRDDSGFDEL